MLGVEKRGVKMKKKKKKKNQKKQQLFDQE